MTCIVPECKTLKFMDAVKTSPVAAQVLTDLEPKAHVVKRFCCGFLTPPQERRASCPPGLLVGSFYSVSFLGATPLPCREFVRAPWALSLRLCGKLGSSFTEGEMRKGSTLDCGHSLRFSS